MRNPTPHSSTSPWSARPDTSCLQAPRPLLSCRLGDIELLPVPAYIVRAFQNYPLVALSEMHGNAESQALFVALVRDSAFQALVSDIVVEFGNARFQDVVDRYVAGENIPPDALSRIWRDTTQVSGIFDLAMYAQMLAVVRDVNLGLAPGRKLRVWLGDPPIDWATVTSPADEDMNDWRDAFFARTVQDRIRKQGRRALVFIGGAHIGRRVDLSRTASFTCWMRACPGRRTWCRFSTSAPSRRPSRRDFGSGLRERRQRFAAPGWVSST